MLLAGGIAAVIAPRFLRVMVGRAMQAQAPADVPREVVTREVTFSEQRAEAPPPPYREAQDPATIARTLRRFASVP